MAFVALDVVAILWMLVVVSSTLQFAKRRNRFPLKERFPGLVIAYNVCLLLMAPLGLSALRNVCAVYELMSVSLIVLSLLICVLRAVLLLFKYNIAENLLMAELQWQRQHADVVKHGQFTAASLAVSEGALLSERKGLVSWSENWFTRWRSLTRPRFLFLIGATPPLFILAVQLSHASEFDFPNACSSATAGLQSVSALLLAVFSGIDGLMFVLLAVKLHRFADDGFGVRFEFRVIGALVALSLLVDVLLPSLGNPSALSSGLILFAFGVVFLSVMTIWPLYLSYKYERYVQSDAQAGKVLGLDDLLRVPGGFESFRAFCNTEFSAENILFFKHILDYKAEAAQGPQEKCTNEEASADLLSLLNTAQSIHHTFLRVGSPFEVNVSGRIRSAVARQLELLATAVHTLCGVQTIEPAPQRTESASKRYLVQASEHEAPAERKAATAASSAAESPALAPLPTRLPGDQQLSPVQDLPARSAAASSAEQSLPLPLPGSLPSHTQPELSAVTTTVVQIGALPGASGTAPFELLRFELLTVFDEASASVKSLMESNSFLRFRNTAHFRILMDAQTLQFSRAMSHQLATVPPIVAASPASPSHAKRTLSGNAAIAAAAASSATPAANGGSWMPGGFNRNLSPRARMLDTAIADGSERSEDASLVGGGSHFVSQSSPEYQKSAALRLAAPFPHSFVASLEPSATHSLAT